MAPQKTMVVGQQQPGLVDQSSSISQAAIVTAKPRKPRKSKQQQQPQQRVLFEDSPQCNNNSGRVDKQQSVAANDIQQPVKISQSPANERKSTSNNKQDKQQQLTTQPQQTVVACERASIARQQQNKHQTENKVPTTVPKQQEQQQQLQQSLPNTKQQQQHSAGEPQKQQRPSGVTTTTASLISKQISSEDTDDIDAGIELDGSSNSGSSIKDINEDTQTTKSASVSPVMAQSNLITNNGRSTTKHAMEVGPVEQLTGSMCTEMAPKTKKALATKQQLAADQLVIDADEQQLQQKLLNRQKQQDNSSSNAATSASGKTKVSLPSLSMANTSNIDNQQTTTSNSNGSTPAQSPALCKVCDQHVYQMERMLAEKSVYHKKCFRCQQCNIQLRVDNYSSHEGQLYCKVHHRQLLQPQAKLNSEDDVDIVAKSTYKQTDEYLLQRGRLSELSLSFLSQTSEGLRQRQMIICENEPAELPKDVVRSDTKIDDGIEQLNLNLKDLAQRFERGAANSSGDDSQPASAGVVVEKPSVSIKKTLMAFESRGGTSEGSSDDSKRVTERPVVRKLTNLNGFFERKSSQEGGDADASNQSTTIKPLAVRRSESLMSRLKKYESRIAGEQVVDDDDGEEGDDDENNNRDGKPNKTDNHVPKKLTSIDLSSLKSQWENGDINKRRLDEDSNDDSTNNQAANGDSTNCNGNSPQLEKTEELHRIRQQLARKKLGESGNVRNIYENAIKEAQLQKKQEAKRNQSDLPALNRFSTTEIQQQLLQNGSNDSQSVKNQFPNNSNKDHFQLNLSKKANKLKEKFELGLINNDSRDDSDQSDCEDGPVLSKLEQIRQEKMEDLSIFTEGEIRAREARNMFQQIDRRLSAASSGGIKGSQFSANARPSLTNSSRTSSIDQTTPVSRPSMTTNNQNGSSNNTTAPNNNHLQRNIGNERQVPENQPIRLTNNVRI